MEVFGMVEEKSVKLNRFNKLPRFLSINKLSHARMSRPASVPVPLPDCLRTTDNRVACPPRMSDGRAFTDYRPRCASMATSLAATYGNEQARSWMTTSAEHLIANARQLSLHKNSCNRCDTATMMNGDVVPESAVQICTAESCGVATSRVPGGLGLGRRYTTDRSDTAGIYISHLPGHMDQTFKSRGVQGSAATCATDEERDVVWSGFHASVTPSLAGKR